MPQQGVLPLPECIALSALPSVALENRSALPDEPGIYFVLEKTTLRSIGRTKSLKTRWFNHHRLRQYLPYQDIAIAWLLVGDIRLLPAVERACIAYCAPQDNEQENPYQEFTTILVLKTTRRRLKQLALNEERPMDEVLADVLQNYLQHHTLISSGNITEESEHGRDSGRTDTAHLLDA